MLGASIDKLSYKSDFAQLLGGRKAVNSKNILPKIFTKLRKQAEKFTKKKFTEFSVDLETLSLEETRIMLHELRRKRNEE
jgi:hypothetical protein